VPSHVCFHVLTILVTGICECVGVSAPILGGGHGWLQGQYGLLADQVISARFVLPNGEAVTVSDDSNPDLFWAIKGAGHNFGLVTEWEYRIYDIKNPKWSYEIFVFLGDKLEALYELTNEMKKIQPPEVVHWGYIIRVEEIDPDHVCNIYTLIQAVLKLTVFSPSSGTPYFMMARFLPLVNTPNRSITSGPFS
jgi:FAD/FMN-containing dehydrogenase